MSVVFQLSGCDFDKTLNSLLKGPTRKSIIQLANERYTVAKVKLDEQDLLSDFVACYKSTLQSRVTVILAHQSVIDTGGVRRQTYTRVFQMFAENNYIKLFDGTARNLRPHYSTQARSSGLLKILGSMVGHSILQDGIGFPYLSPLCYWYVIKGTDTTLNYVTLNDIGEDAKYIVTKVHIYYTKTVI